MEKKKLKIKYLVPDMPRLCYMQALSLKGIVILGS